MLVLMFALILKSFMSALISKNKPSFEGSQRINEMKIEVTLFGSNDSIRKKIIKQYASLEQTISFDDEKKESMFLCEHAEAMRLCINLPPRVAKYNWQKNELYVDLNAFKLTDNDGYNDITQSSILSKDARQ